MSFDEKVVIVTGASSGIGASIAFQFAEQGAKVVLVARNENKLKVIAEKCQKYGSKPLIIPADVSKDDDVKEIIKRTITQFDKIDVLINNAATFGSAAVFDVNAMELYDRIMATNLRSVVYLTNLAAPHLIKSKGNIINISSAASVVPLSADFFAYCTSKAGLDHFSRCAALGLASKGVRVNTINPGPVRTLIFNNNDMISPDVDIWEEWRQKTALERVSEPSEIGELALFLASDKARAITGTSCISDNGLLLM